MKVDELIAHLERTADPSFAAEWDSCGLQVRGTVHDVQTMAVALDPSPEAVSKAVECQADFLLTHHPLSLTPELPCKDDAYTQVLRSLFQHDIWLYAAHTSLDVCTCGPPAWLADQLSLRNVEALLPLEAQTEDCFRLLLDRPLPRSLLADCAADPGVLAPQDASDSRTDILVRPGSLEAITSQIGDRAVILAIEKTATLQAACSQRGFGIQGDLERPMDWARLSAKLGSLFGMTSWTLVGRKPEQITRLAYCPGSGMSLAGRAFARGAQVFLSGDLKYHQAQEIEPLGLTLDVGHFILEERMMERWAADLADELASRNIRVEFFSGHNPLRSEDRGLS